MDGEKSVALSRYTTLYFRWSLSGQSIETNSSQIDWIMSIETTGSGHIDSTKSKDWSVVMGAQTYSGTNKIGVPQKSFVVLASGSTTISHNNDGTAEIEYAFSQQIKLEMSGVYIDTVTGGDTVTLPTIPRASDLIVSDGVLGVAQTITANRKAASFVHTLRWAAGEYSGTLATLADAVTWSFTPPMTLANNSPSATTVSVDFTLETWGSGTLIGTRTASVIMTIPESVKPSVTVAVTDDAEYAETFGGYVQGQSKAKVVVTAVAAYSSPVQTYSISVDGNTYTAAECVTGALQSTGTVPVTVIVTDARGRSTTVIQNITVFPYVTPSITLLKVNRCDSDGTENDRGSYGKATFSYNITPLSNINEKAAVLRYRASGASEWTTLTLTAVYAADGQTAIFAADDGASFEVDLIITDTFTGSSQRVRLSTAYTLIHYNSSGKGVAFGKVAEVDGLDVGMLAFFRNGFGGTIPAAETDFNTLLTVGKYIMSTDTLTAGMPHAPCSNGGFMWVTSPLDPTITTINAPHAHLLQLYVSRLAEVFIRYVSSGDTATALTFGAWKQIV